MSNKCQVAVHRAAANPYQTFMNCFQGCSRDLNPKVDNKKGIGIVPLFSSDIVLLSLR